MTNANMVKIDDCSVWPGNTRTPSAEGLDELTESIKANGILQPLLARPAKHGGVEIIAGRRRLSAAIDAGLSSVPVYIVELTDAQAAAAAATENLIREDFTPLDAADAVSRALDAADGDIQAAAVALARPVGWVRRVANLTNLTGTWYKAAKDHRLSMPFLVQLARLPKATQDAVYVMIPNGHYGQLIVAGGDTRLLGTITERLTAAISDCKWLAKDKQCDSCSARSDADLLLFPEFADAKPICLHAECREKKRLAYIETQKSKAAKTASTTPACVATTEWSRFDDSKKMDAEHTVPCVVTEGPSSGSIVWRKPDRHGQDVDATPKGPTPAQRCAAKFIRSCADAVNDISLEKWAAAADRQALLAAVLMFGCSGENPMVDDIVHRFLQIAAFGPADDEDIRADIADRIRHGVLERLKFDKVSDCEDAYAWAKAITELFMPGKEDQP